MVYGVLGSPGSNNDININDRSPLWVDIADGTVPKCNYKIFDQEEDQLYFLADNIYAQFPIFMQSCGDSTDEKVHYFSKRLEAVRKDVERAFGILQARFGFLRKPCLLWYVEDIESAVLCCIALHNMIIEEEFEYPESTCNSLRGSEFLPVVESTPRLECSNFVELYLSNVHKAQSLNKFKTMRLNLRTCLLLSTCT